MIGILHRYRLVVLILSLIALALIIWFIVTNQEIDKIPSRGTFITLLGNLL
ncbi:MAG TPA: hypothetical protein GXX36_08945 [Clostridiaceae bacterium]|nr:hypothetical protein [Clostridiaceae bacterium]